MSGELKYTPKPWLWPDRTIGKRESRELREEHNEAINQRADLLEALQEFVATSEPSTLNYENRCAAAMVNARATINKATGGDR